MRLALRLYNWLQAFYPRGFRGEYGAEMASVFTRMLMDRRASAAQLLLRELRDAPQAIWRARQEERRMAMYLMDATQPQPEPAAKTNPAGSWKHAGLAALGLLFYLWLAGSGIFFDILQQSTHLTSRTPAQICGSIAGIILVIDLIVVLWSWRAGWPRWSFPYLGTLLTWILLFVQSLIRNDGSLLIFLPWLQALVLFFMVFLGKWWKGLDSLYTQLTDDWTLLGLSYFSFVPFMFVIFLNETRYEYEIELVLCLILSLGVMAYMRSVSRLKRVVALPVTVLMGGLVTAGYFLGRLDGWQSNSVGFHVAMVTLWTALTIAPLLLVGLLELGRDAFDRWMEAA